MSETSRFAFPVPLTSQIRAIAQHKAELDLDENASRLKILRKLAFHAVSYYLRCMAFDVDQQYSDSQERILFHLLEGTDIYVRGIGRLECCPVNKTDTTYKVPIDAREGRLAYVVVEIDEHYQEAQIIGFFPTPLPESKTLLLNQLYPLSDLPQYLYHSIPLHLSQLWSWAQTQLTNLSNTFANPFMDWYIFPEFSSSMRTHDEQVQFSKHIQLDSLNLIIKFCLTPKMNDSLRVDLWIESEDKKTLPSNTQLIILNDQGQTFQQLSATGDSFSLAAHPFSAIRDEQFAVKLSYGQVQHMERFVA